MLEVFFDYACPYCWHGHENLVALAEPTLEIEWRPCESHPRPERYGAHSDLCIQGMFYARDCGVDLWAYHERMYRAALVDRIDIENLDVLAEAVRGLLDPEDFRRAIRSGQYAQALSDANDYAYERSGVWAVPAYRMDERKLDAVQGVGVSMKQLAAFISARA